MPPQAATDSGKLEYTYEPCEPVAKRSKTKTSKIYQPASKSRQ